MLWIESAVLWNVQLKSFGEVTQGAKPNWITNYSNSQAKGIEKTKEANDFLKSSCIIYTLEIFIFKIFVPLQSQKKNQKKWVKSASFHASFDRFREKLKPATVSGDSGQLCSQANHQTTAATFLLLMALSNITRVAQECNTHNV